MLEENDINSYLYLGLLCMKIVHGLVRFLLRDLLANYHCQAELVAYSQPTQACHWKLAINLLTKI